MNEVRSGSSDGRFKTTVWAHINGEIGDRGWDWVCRTYWTPVYTHLRWILCMNSAEAEDVTQEFFLYLYEHQLLRRAQKTCRFRTFLKGILRNFLRSRFRNERRLKRGGGWRRLSLNHDEFDRAADAPSADALLDREWVCGLITQARKDLAEALTKEDRIVDLHIFEAYSDAAPGERPTYSSLAREFGMSDWDVWNSLATTRKSLRVRLRSLLRTPGISGAEVDQRLDSLVSYLQIP